MQVVNKFHPSIECESTLVHCIQKSPTDEFSRDHNTSSFFKIQIALSPSIGLYLFSIEKGKNRQLGTGFFVHHRIVPGDKRVDHHMKIMLEGEFNAKEGRENIFKPTIGN